MERIYKYAVPFGGPQDIELIEGRPVLHVGMQHDHDEDESVVVFWVLDSDDPDLSRRLRRFQVAGTGWALPDKFMRHWGTVQSGPYAWHLIELWP